MFASIFSQNISILLKTGAEKASSCARSRDKNINSTQMIYVGSSDMGTQSSHKQKHNKNFWIRKAPAFRHGPTQELLEVGQKSRGIY